MSDQMGDLVAQWGIVIVLSAFVAAVIVIGFWCLVWFVMLPFRVLGWLFGSKREAHDSDKRAQPLGGEATIEKSLPASTFRKIEKENAGHAEKPLK